jgi:hypothetical protein
MIRYTLAAIHLNTLTVWIENVFWRRSGDQVRLKQKKMYLGAARQALESQPNYKFFGSLFGVRKTGNGEIGADGIYCYRTYFG